MTYCLALKLDEGLVFASDTRTNAGADYVTSYSKTHRFELGPDRTFVVCTAGNLSTSQEIIARLRADLNYTDGRNNLLTFNHMFEAANHVGKISLDVQEWHDRGFRRSNADGTATLLFGGQIAGSEPEIYLVYPEGNPIAASPDTPYLQIGETKYGKPILDRLMAPTLTMAQASKLALVSLDATIRSNATVGPPYDLTLYRGDAFAFEVQERVETEDAFYESLRASWQQGQQQAFAALPPFPWEA